MVEEYTHSVEVPTVEDYCRLRASAGLSPRSENAAAAGLPHTTVGIVIRQAGRAVGMGRAVGDGLFYQIVDIAVEPAHQKRGLGKTIVANLMSELKKVAPAEAYVSLIADGQANSLYTLSTASFPLRPRPSAWLSGSADNRHLLVVDVEGWADIDIPFRASSMQRRCARSGRP